MELHIGGRWLAGMLVALSLTACGGGGGGGGPSPSPDGGPGSAPKGIEGTGKVVSHGSITAFGSIFVNGVEYSTDKAAIQVNGRSVSGSELKLGQVVTVVGTLNAADPTQAVADTVTFTAPIVGPVQSIDAAQASLVVLGQPVLIDGATRFDEDIAPASLAGLAVGMEIEVSGFRDSRGVLAARSIARRGAGQSLAATGDAAGVDATARRLTIGTLVVDYSAAELAGFGSRQPVNGDFVRAEAATLEDSGRLKATRLALVDRRLPATAGESGHLQGRVTRYGSVTDFDVDGYRVTTDASTKFNSVDPAGFGGLRLDRFVTVFGVLLADGRLLAADIRTNNLVTINVAVSEVNAYALQSGPYRCETGGTTYTVDGRSATWSAIRPGDVAILYQSFGADQPISCPIVTVNRALRGPVETVDAARGRLRVMGQQVHVNGRTRLLDATGARAIDALGSLQPGDIVEIAGYRSSTGALAATRLDRAAADAPRQVTGTIRTADETRADHLWIGELLIDYSVATVGGFPSGGPAAGQRVIVRGTQPAADTLRATDLEYDSPTLRGTAVGPAHVIGPITQFTSVGDFRIEGRSIQQAPPAPTNPQVYPACVKERLQLDGFVTAITATQPLPGIDFAHVGLYEGTYGQSFGGDGLTLTGRVDSVDLAQRTVLIAGHEVALHPLALLRQPGGDCGSTLPAASIAAGDTLMVRGDAGPGARTLIAGLVERRAATAGDATLSLAGNLGSLTDAGFVLDGLRVGTTAQTAYRNCDAPVTREEFVLAVRRELNKPGGKVSASAEGRPAAGLLELPVASLVQACLDTGEVTGTVRAQVESIDAATGRLTVLGMAVQLTSPVTVEDRSSGTAAASTLGQVVAGQFVEIAVRWRPLISALETGSIIILDRSGSGTPYIGALPDERRRPDVIVFGRTLRTDAETVFANGGAGSTADNYFNNPWDVQEFDVVKEADGSLRVTRVNFYYADYGW